MSIAVLVSCASTSNVTNEAELLIAQGRYEEGLNVIATAKNGGMLTSEHKAARTRLEALAGGRLLQEARSAFNRDRLEDAERIYSRLLAIDPENFAARNELDNVQQRKKLDAQVSHAEELLRTGQTSEANTIVRNVLLSAPNHRKAKRLAEQIEQQLPGKNSGQPAPSAEFKKPVTLEFRDVSLKSVFDVIWHASGINFILDRDVKTDQKVSLFVRDVTAEEAIDSLLATQQLERKQVSPKTLFIYPKTPQKLAEYQELLVRNFFLSHADAKQIQALLKSVIKSKEVFVDEKRNLVVLRDSPEQVALAAKLVEAHDQPEPEVMLALDVIEIRRTKLNELGMAFPGQISFGVANPLSLAAFNNIGSSGINIGFAGPAGLNMLGTLNLQNSNSDTNMLANPRIRVRNREKAKIHIGDRLPVVTTTSSSTSSFVGETVNYLDVGLKLEVEPQVMLDNHVVIKVNLEVSSATQSKVNSKFYDIGTRNTNTVLTIRDGETQVLAGLIRDDERESSSRLPGLGQIPVIGRLFASERSEQDKTEIILAITPQVITNLLRPSAALTEYPGGTESGARSAGTVTSMPTATSNAAKPPPPAAAPAYANMPTTNSASGSSVTFSASPTNTAASTGSVPAGEFEPPPGVGLTPTTPQ